jgi:hypothetical protein
MFYAVIKLDGHGKHERNVKITSRRQNCYVSFRVKVCVIHSIDTTQVDVIS